MYSQQAGTQVSESDVATVLEASPEVQVALEPGNDLELETLRDKLALYEAFDSLINDNVARSAELFRSLYEERERARAEYAKGREEIDASIILEAERRLADDRQRMQSTLMSLMDEASRMQRQIDGLIQRIAEAITEFKIWSPGDDQPEPPAPQSEV